MEGRKWKDGRKDGRKGKDIRAPTADMACSIAPSSLFTKEGRKEGKKEGMEEGKNGRK
jgi:hypothetical protein